MINSRTNDWPYWYFIYQTQIIHAATEAFKKYTFGGFSKTHDVNALNVIVFVVIVFSQGLQPMQNASLNLLYYALLWTVVKKHSFIISI